MVDVQRSDHQGFGYFLSFANGFDTFCLLDVFLDFQFDPRLVVRAGRFKTPFTYEFLVEPIQGLILPERPCSSTTSA